MPREERLCARPIERIVFEGRVGWLYLWNNGDTQMLWLDVPSNRAAAAPVRSLQCSPTRKGDSQTE